MTDISDSSWSCDFDATTDPTSASFDCYGETDSGTSWDAGVTIDPVPDVDCSGSVSDSGGSFSCTETDDGVDSNAYINWD